MQCPQCGAETPDEEWNCVSCRINVYWASQHYADLAGIRQRQGLRSSPATPSFLLQAHANAMDERADRGGKVEHKVRQIARRAMSREAPNQASVPAEVTGGSHRGRGTRLERAGNSVSIRGGRPSAARTTGGDVSAEQVVLPPDSDGGTPLAGDAEAGDHESQPQARAQVQPEVECSVGVMAYNEEANIAHALDSILRQELTGKRIREVIVVASGCEDRDRPHRGRASPAGNHASALSSSAPRRQGVGHQSFHRRGPVSRAGHGERRCDGRGQRIRCFSCGILRTRPWEWWEGTPYLSTATGPSWGMRCIFSGACMTGSPAMSPKLGEMVAFRNVVPSIPLDTAVDELSIQALVTQLGYRLVYEPRAVVYNRGPATVHDFLRQRRRIYAGHLRIREQQAYSAPTMSAWRAGRALLGSESFSTPRAALWSVGTVGLEATARALGLYDIARGRRSHHVWEMCDTTKDHIAGRG